MGKKLIKRAVLGLPKPIIGRVMVAHYLKRHPHQIDECLAHFLSADEQRNKAYVNTVKAAVRAAMNQYLIAPEEYFLYDFPHLSDQEKRSFVGDLERTILCSRLYNVTASGYVFMDKMKTYDAFAPFFKRDVCLVSGEADYRKFLDFSQTHETFMVKPTAASRGNGIALVSRDADVDAREQFQEILRKGACVLEERIEQGPELAALHPQSVNTVRYATYYENGTITTLACFLKIGRGASVVDNGGAGGLLAAVDSETGVILTAGRTEWGEEYPVHPDTGIAFVGYQLPEWHAAKEMVSELVKVLPDQKYVGWDLAYSTQGWVLVEGNSGGQFVGPQISLKKGVRPLIDKTFGSL